MVLHSYNNSFNELDKRCGLRKGGKLSKFIVNTKISPRVVAQHVIYQPRSFSDAGR